MRVNIYAEEMPEEPRLELIVKDIEGQRFTALRIYLQLPASDFTRMSQCPDCLGTGYHRDDYCSTCGGKKEAPLQVQGPFMHRAGDDDSAAVTFWGKRDLRKLLRRALDMLDDHYGDGGAR
jgi:hypothetical protein